MAEAVLAAFQAGDYTAMKKLFRGGASANFDVACGAGRPSQYVEQIFLHTALFIVHARAGSSQ
jgi:hypothetical protein